VGHLLANCRSSLLRESAESASASQDDCELALAAGQWERRNHRRVIGVTVTCTGNERLE
jgi:hypothetical protein